jgi:hypothetical protein
MQDRSKVRPTQMDEVGRGRRLCYDWGLASPSNLPTYMDKRGRKGGREGLGNS